MSVVNTVNSMIKAANVQDISTGKVSGISKNEYTEIVNYLTEVIKKGGKDAEIAQVQLSRLQYMKNCAFNQADIKNSKPGWLSSIFSKEDSLKRENVIGYDTTLLEARGELDDANKYVEFSSDKL